MEKGRRRRHAEGPGEEFVFRQFSARRVIEGGARGGGQDSSAWSVLLTLWSTYSKILPPNDELIY
jgi:hypothetical protein